MHSFISQLRNDKELSRGNWFFFVYIQYSRNKHVKLSSDNTIHSNIYSQDELLIDPADSGGEGCCFCSPSKYGLTCTYMWDGKKKVKYIPEKIRYVKSDSVPKVM